MHEPEPVLRRVDLLEERVRGVSRQGGHSTSRFHK
jgi:hypothetical protein